MRIRLIFFFLLLAILPLRGEAPPLGLEAAIVELTNEHRALAKLPPLRSVAVLADSARGHSREMAEKGYFSHLSPTESRKTPSDRLAALDVHPMAVGENIYMSSGRPPEQVVRAAVDAWMKSPGHRANILKPEFTCIGIGMHIRGEDVYVTQVFSSDVDE